MATLRVYHAAAGANNGTSWADAYTDIQSAWTAWASGDVIWVASDHAQTQASAETFAASAASNNDPCVWYSVDRSNDTYLPAVSPQVAVTGSAVGITFSDYVRLYGIFFQIENGAYADTGTGSNLYVDCNFKWTALSTTRTMTVGTGTSALNCTINNTTAGQGLSLVLANTTIWEGCIFMGRGSTTLFSLADAGANATTGILFIGCDFSGITSSTVFNAAGGSLRLINCQMSSLTPTAPNVMTGLVRIYASAVDGGSTAKNYIAEHLFLNGTVTQDTAIYRDVGWTDEDGSTQLSHKMTPASSIRGSHTPIFGPDLRAYVDSTGSVTFTVYCVHDFTAAPTLDEAWFDVLYLGTADSVGATIGSSRTPLSATAITTGSEAWTGASGKTKGELSKTVTINKTGTYLLRVYLGKYESGKALWYDPLVEVS